MKANLIRRMAIAFCLLSCISIYSCKKDNSASQDTTSANLSTDDNKQQQVSNEADIISNDANTTLNAESDFSGSNSSSVSLTGNTEINSVGGNTNMSALINVHQLICDATVTYDTANNQRIITIVYDGTNCWGNRTRFGKVIITLPLGQHWKDAGATANIVIDELKITRLRDSKSVVINGNKTYTNVSGGLLKDLATLQTITHTITGTMSIDFDNGTTRAWN